MDLYFLDNDGTLKLKGRTITGFSDDELQTLLDKYNKNFKGRGRNCWLVHNANVQSELRKPYRYKGQEIMLIPVSTGLFLKLQRKRKVSFF